MGYVTIKVRIEAELEDRASGEPTDEQIESIINQCCADAVNGTFGHFPDASRPPGLKEGASYDPQTVWIDDESRAETRIAKFTMQIPDWMFPVASGGLQHLIGILASDTFPTQLGKCRIRVQIEELGLSSELTESAHLLFRSGPSSIDRLRSAFSLAEDEPFIAFSVKPRTGFSPAWAKEVVRKVTKAGVHLVEFDTRYLEDPRYAMDGWEELHRIAVDSAAHEGRKAAFAPNLSQSSVVAVEAAIHWCDEADLPGPLTVKVDGGLDALSTMQGIRMRCENQPIITSYPLLRSSMERHLGSKDGWLQMLILSGVDVVYPGNRPTFQEFRNVGGDFARGRSLSVKRYRDLAKRVVPTIAAGAHPGHLHADYALLGSSVAYFLGGAIALHEDGVEAGARLCVNVLKESQHLVKEAREGRGAIQEISGNLVQEIESKYKIHGLVPWYQDVGEILEGGMIRPFYEQAG